ncbi:MAG TPA: MltA domain-containing protein [Phycisphaerae bacterium]|nr:MltA domain-containing protein [Phycisphaerae bacterium]
MSRVSRLLLGGCCLLLACGCHKPRLEQLEPFEPQVKKDYGRPLPPGELALRRIDPAYYPDFSEAYAARAGLERAVRASLEYLAKPSSRRYFPYGEITHERAAASLEAFLGVLREAASPAELNRLIRERFHVYQSVGCDGRGTVYFTGYYCPIFEGRKQPDAQFCYPLYGLPLDLVKDEEGRTLGRQTPDGGLAPYPARREIEAGGILRGQEIAWLKDPFEAYVVTVQGSAKLRLADGALYELGYAGNNGHAYAPVGELLIRDGAIRRDELSLQTLIRYFAAHPDQVPRYCWVNDRYVFFQEAKGGPYGSINVPVVPYRSIATDKQVFPRACLAFVKTAVPVNYGGRVQPARFSSFALDHDTGGAIRAAGRADIFMGVGPQAEALAGRTGAEGALYYLFVPPKALARVAY